MKIIALFTCNLELLLFIKFRQADDEFCMQMTVNKPWSTHRHTLQLSHTAATSNWTSCKLASDPESSRVESRLASSSWVLPHGTFKCLPIKANQVEIIIDNNNNGKIIISYRFSSVLHAACNIVLFVARCQGPRSCGSSERKVKILAASETVAKQVKYKCI